METYGLVLLMGVLLSPEGQTGASKTRTAESILAEFDALGRVELEPRRVSEPGYLSDYRRRQHTLSQRKAALLLEACRSAPTDARVTDWMPQRWQLLGLDQEPLTVADEILDDIEKHVPEFPLPSVVREAGYYRALYQTHKPNLDARAKYDLVTRFTKENPADPRGAILLQTLADAKIDDRELLKTIYRRLASEYAGSHHGKFAPGRLRQVESVGQPVELVFDDAISGKRVSLSDFRGKVILLDFWATTCPPCSAERPRLKGIYERLAGLGVEFVGVSLDKPPPDVGLQAVRDFVSKKGIPWPQYHQGRGFDSEFSKSWGVGSTPTKFLIDVNGAFVGTVMTDEIEARVKGLLSK